jgi:hypothetical protein
MFFYTVHPRYSEAHGLKVKIHYSKGFTIVKVNCIKNYYLYRKSVPEFFFTIANYLLYKNSL